MAIEAPTEAIQASNGTGDRKCTSPRKDRLVTIDTMKGMSMVMIWLCHFAWGWHASDWTSLFKLLWLVLDFFGPVMFLSMSVLGTMLSLEHNRALGRKPGHPPKSLARISYLFIIGECVNLCMLWRFGLFHVFGWNIVTTIAFFSLLAPRITRLGAKTRVALVACIALAYHPVANLLVTNISAAGVNPDNMGPGDLANPAALVYYLFFHSGMMSPVFSWTIVPLVVSLAFEPLVTSLGGAPPGRVHAELKRIGAAGVAMVVASLSLGGFAITPGYSPGVVAQLNEPGLLSWPFPEGVPAILDRHSPHYLFYMLGLVLIIFALLCEYQHVRRREIAFQRKINNFGALSLTAFELSHLGFWFDQPSIPFVPFMAIFIVMVVVVVNLFDLWATRRGSKYSLEWFMNAYVAMVLGIAEKIDSSRLLRS